MKFFKKIFIFCLWLIWLPLLAQNGEGAEMIVSGIYHGKNITVQNPTVGNNIHCTNEVFVNGKRTMFNITASLYEINLGFLKTNDSVTIIITHKGNCTPKVLNPQVLRPSDTFLYVSSTVDKDAVRWTTQGERSTDTYFVEHFANHTWLTLQKFTPSGGVYVLPVKHYPGINRYRIRYVEKDGRIFYSPEVDFKLEIKPTVLQPVTFYPKNVTDKIYLSRQAPYLVLSPNGTVLKKGNEKEILLADLKTGVYTLVVDNKREKFFKK